MFNKEIKKVSLEKRKNTNSTGFRFLLMYYYGIENGKPIRKYKTIKNSKKLSPKEYQRYANEVLSKEEKRISEDLSNVVLTYFKDTIESKSQYNSNLTVFNSAYKLFSEYIKNVIGYDIKFDQVKGTFFKDLINFINNYQKKNGELLSNNTKHAYFLKIMLVFRRAMDDGLISGAKIRDVKGFHYIPNEKDVLTEEEINKLIRTDSKNSNVKNAFIFGCLTGLRKSDIINYKLSNNVIKGNKMWVRTIQKKTKRVVTIPLHIEAQKIVSRDINPDEKYFRLNTNFKVYLDDWIKTAGINKRVTFHTSRRSFLTILGKHTNMINELMPVSGHASPFAALPYLATDNNTSYGLIEKAFIGINKLAG
jgi:integrase